MKAQRRMKQTRGKSSYKAVFLNFKFQGVSGTRTLRFHNSSFVIMKKILSKLTHLMWRNHTMSQGRKAKKRCMDGGGV